LLPSERRRHGSWTLALLLALTALTALSVAWSVEPEDSWRRRRMLAYCGVLAGSIASYGWRPSAGRRCGRDRAGRLAVCAYGLASKVFPAQGPTRRRACRNRSVTGTRSG
jgi:hypothetical protein